MSFCSSLSVDKLKLSSFYKFISTFNVDVLNSNVDVLNSSELLFILSLALIIAR